MMDFLTKIFCIVLGLETLVLMLTFVFNALLSLSSEINAEKRRAEQEKREIFYKMYKSFIFSIITITI